jgi:hypothetical protein
LSQDKIETNCKCKYFENEKEPSDYILEYFKVLSTSEFDNKESTTLLKCPKCSSYYLLNIHNPIYTPKEFISIKKYIPKTNENEEVDERGLVKVLKTYNGIMTDIEINEYYEFYIVCKKALQTMKKGDLNENKN